MYFVGVQEHHPEPKRTKKDENIVQLSNNTDFVIFMKECQFCYIITIDPSLDNSRLPRFCRMKKTNN